MRRLVALLASIAMVATALFLRSRIDREQEAGTVRLVCSVELEQACQELKAADTRVSLRVEAAGETADRLATAVNEPDVDGWLVPEPWPEIVDGRRRSRSLPPLFPDRRDILARSPIKLVVWRDRAQVLSGKLCPATVNWKCLGEAAAAGRWVDSGGREDWGSPKLGLADPATDGLGLLVLGQAVANWFDRSDLALHDLEPSDDFGRWLSAVGRAAARFPTSPLRRMLVTGRAEFDATGTIEAEAGPLTAGRDVDLLYPSPMATADVSLATVGDSPQASAVGELRSARALRKGLADNGWRVPGQGSIQGVGSDPLPPTNGLPPAGLLDALRDRWRQVAR